MGVLVCGYFPQNSQPVTCSVLLPLVMLMNNREKNKLPSQPHQQKRLTLKSPFFFFASKTRGAQGSRRRDRERHHSTPQQGAAPEPREEDKGKKAKTSHLHPLCFHGSLCWLCCFLSPSHEFCFLSHHWGTVLLKQTPSVLQLQPVAELAEEGCNH